MVTSPDLPSSDTLNPIASTLADTPAAAEGVYEHVENSPCHLRENTPGRSTQPRHDDVDGTARDDDDANGSCQVQAIIDAATAGTVVTCWLPRRDARLARDRRVEPADTEASERIDPQHG